MNGGPSKSSPDDTSLLGLKAVWSELDAPMPPKRSRGSRHARGARRRRARRAPGVGAPVLLILTLAVALAVGVIAVLLGLLSS